MKAVKIDRTKALIEDSIRGNRRAQFELYNLYSKAMYNICCRMLNSAEDAEDVLQESFIDAFKGLAGFKGQSTFGAWLKRIVINKSINHLRKKKLKIVEIEHQILVDKEDVESEIFYQVEPQQIHFAIKELAAGSRLIFNLYMLEGYDHVEIAQILNISVSTSKTQLRRAKSKLKEKLQTRSYVR